MQTHSQDERKIQPAMHFNPNAGPAETIMQERGHLIGAENTRKEYGRHQDQQKEIQKYVYSWTIRSGHHTRRN